MPHDSLIENLINDLKPKAKSYKKYIEKGLYIEVNPNGKKGWRFKYKYNGKEKRISFGPYPKVGLSSARQYRDMALGFLSHNIDPSTRSEIWKQKKTAPKKHLNDIEKALKAIPAKEQKFYRSLLENHNERLEKQQRKDKIVENLLSNPPSKHLELHIQESEKKHNELSAHEKMQLISLFEKLVKDHGLPKEFYDENIIFDFLHAHLSSAKDFSGLRMGSKIQKEALDVFAIHSEKIRKKLNELKEEGVFVPTFVDACLETALQYFEEYSIIDDEMLQFAFNTRQKCDKTDYIRAVAHGLNKLKTPITGIMVEYSFVLARFVLKVRGIEIDPQEYRKTLVKNLQ